MTPPATQLRARLLGPGPGDEYNRRQWLYGWIATLAITAVAGVMRFWRLDHPGELVFDETYYVKQGYSLLRFGYERTADETPPPDELFTNGTPDVFGTGADFVVHPPVGKWMVGLGMQLFGTDSGWGWRFAAALVGTLSVLMIIRIARRLFSSTLLGLVAGVLLTFDGHHFVHSRTSLLDVFLMFWVLAAFGALVADRHRARERLAERMPGWLAAGGRRRSGLGPWLGWRPWRLVAGLCLGLACGVKWSGLYFVAVFGLLTLAWDMGARRAVGLSRWWLAGPVKDGLPAFASIVGVGALTYLVSWTGWLRSQDGYLRQWAVDNSELGPQWLPAAMRSLWKYHQDAYAFHVGLSTSHPYEANPWSWLVMGRPTSFYYRGLEQGQGGCTADQCSQAITSLGTPVLWWAATGCVVVALLAWALRRDWRAGAVLSGLVAGYLPWFQYQERTIYTFYAVAFTPWVVLTVTYVLGLVLGRPEARDTRRIVGALAVGVFVVWVVLCFAYFWPIYTAQTIPQPSWSQRMWWPSWI